MTEGTQATGTPTGMGKKKNKKVMLIVAGTGMAMLVAGVMVQVMRPPAAFPETAAAPAEAAGKSSVNDPAAKKVARVNRGLISYDELADECVARYGSEILENIINRKIIQQACQAQGIEITEAEVNEEIVRISKKFGLAVDQWLQMLQAERKLSPSQYRRDIIWPMLALRRLAGVEITITEEDLQKAFIRNYGPRVKAKAIVLDNSRRATEVWEKARLHPDEFGRLAREHSTDAASRPLEGSIPPIRRHGGSPELEQAAFKLKPGEVSGVIQIGTNQYIILLCEGLTEKVVEDRSEVEDILKQELQEEKMQKSVAEVFERLKNEARVDNYLTGISTGGDKKAAAAKTSQVKQTSGSASPTMRQSSATTAAGTAPQRAPVRKTAPRKVPAPQAPAN